MEYLRINKKNYLKNVMDYPLKIYKSNINYSNISNKIELEIFLFCFHFIAEAEGTRVAISFTEGQTCNIMLHENEILL